mmetsp:Transcript_15739/g.44650  ORF Transcript_15739/g.44650 Transcript_15739/m.44650 type:complete len:161 (-) Transcript_15739:65-547(-)
MDEVSTVGTWANYTQTYTDLQTGAKLSAGEEAGEEHLLGELRVVLPRAVVDRDHSGKTADLVGPLGPRSVSPHAYHQPGAHLSDVGAAGGSVGRGACVASHTHGPHTGHEAVEERSLLLQYRRVPPGAVPVNDIGFRSEPSRREAAAAVRRGRPDAAPEL